MVLYSGSPILVIHEETTVIPWIVRHLNPKAVDSWLLKTHVGVVQNSQWERADYDTKSHQSRGTGLSYLLNYRQTRLSTVFPPR